MTTLASWVYKHTGIMGILYVRILASSHITTLATWVYNHTGELAYIHTSNKVSRVRCPLCEWLAIYLLAHANASCG